MRRIALSIAQIGLIGLALVAFWRGPAGLPAFSADARGVGPDGAWQAGEARDLYDIGDYYLALSGRHLAAALAVADAPERVIAHATAAAENAERSLSRRPSDPYAWAALARAERLRDRPAAAVAALERSYVYGPNSTALAFARVVTGYDLWGQLSPPARAAMLQDFRLMHWGDDPKVGQLLRSDPRARALNQLARASTRDD